MVGPMNGPAGAALVAPDPGRHRDPDGPLLHLFGGRSGAGSAGRLAPDRDRALSGLLPGAARRAGAARRFALRSLLRTARGPARARARRAGRGRADRRLRLREWVGQLPPLQLHAPLRPGARGPDAARRPRGLAEHPHHPRAGPRHPPGHHRGPAGDREQGPREDLGPEPGPAALVHRGAGHPPRVTADLRGPDPLEHVRDVHPHGRARGPAHAPRPDLERRGPLAPRQRLLSLRLTLLPMDRRPLRRRGADRHEPRVRPARDPLRTQPHRQASHRPHLHRALRALAGGPGHQERSLAGPGGSARPRRGRAATPTGARPRMARSSTTARSTGTGTSTSSTTSSATTAGPARPSGSPRGCVRGRPIWRRTAARSRSPAAAPAAPT